MPETTPAAPAPAPSLFQRFNDMPSWQAALIVIALLQGGGKVSDLAKDFLNPGAAGREATEQVVQARKDIQGLQDRLGAVETNLVREIRSARPGPTP